MELILTTDPTTATSERKRAARRMKWKPALPDIRLSSCLTKAVIVDVFEVKDAQFLLSGVCLVRFLFSGVELRRRLVRKVDGRYALFDVIVEIVGKPSASPIVSSR
jgi:hypothetical protein